MSSVNVNGAIKNIHRQSTAYVPIVEAITNSIYAIEKSGHEDGRINITIVRDSGGLDFGEPAPITSIHIEDNGIGFTDENTDSFDTLYSPLKAKEGGKGFGRVFFLKHFENVAIESVFKKGDECKRRTFNFGKGNEIVENDNVESSEVAETRSIVKLIKLTEGKLDSDLSIFSHRILEKILSYFTVDDYKCPKITVIDTDGETIVLNDLISDSPGSLIQVVKSDNFQIDEKDFQYKLFKIFKPRNQVSQIVLTAHNQAVTHKSLSDEVPEFASEFVDKEHGNYVVHFYVSGNYLDENVKTERDGFEFGINNDFYLTIGQKVIETRVAEIAKEIFNETITTRYEEKVEVYKKYANDNPWYSSYSNNIDLKNVETKPTKAKLEEIFHKAKYEADSRLKNEVERVIGDSKNQPTSEQIDDLVSKLQQTDTSNLAQYMVYRKLVIGILDKALEWNNEEDKHYEKEKQLHNIIFPMQKTLEDVSSDGHNLWLLDESLSFVEQLSSDVNTFNDSDKRPDLLAFHKAVSYSESTDGHNPVSIFEFKRPNRDDFANRTSDENPISQVIGYAESIKKGDTKTQKGKTITISEDTPFYAYIIAEINPKIREGLKSERFTELPDNEGFYSYHEQYKMHIRYLSWQKVVKDANVRHRRFFEKLGLEGVSK
jgi:hypothetical protein